MSRWPSTLNALGKTSESTQSPPSLMSADPRNRSSPHSKSNPGHSTNSEMVIPQLIKWLTPIVDVLYNISIKLKCPCDSLVSPTQFHILSSTHFNAYSRAFPPANIIFSGIGILLSVSVALALSGELVIMFALARQRSM